ncbi:CGNR zinc finger domain-containing protein [Pseudoroseomonas globiformis]|uniref:CGNR zinc finger domain-containing protein n=1 Tax=Teichococcus globiformis TaxID=2307229 RepID=A0ABV7FYB0_9PROT
MLIDREQKRPGTLHRVGGHPALDFANTISWRDTPHRLDHLQTPEDLVLWARQTDVPGMEPLPAFPAAAQALLGRCVTLRGAILEAGLALAAGREAPPAALSAILAAAAEAASHLRLIPAPGPYALRGRGLDSLPGLLAWSMLDLLRSDRLAGLKCCPAHDCGWLFLDTSRNRSRRWCAMASCGNRAKARQFRTAHRI